MSNTVKCFSNLDEKESLNTLPQIGCFVKINEDICSDVDVLGWLDEQSENRFRVNNVEVETNGIWVDGCDFRIELDECIVLP